MLQVLHYDNGKNKGQAHARNRLYPIFLFALLGWLLLEFLAWDRVQETHQKDEYPPPLTPIIAKKRKLPHPPASYPYCDQNSQQPQCCTPEHCALVQQSTMYSECCQTQQRHTNNIFPLLITATPRSGTVFTQKFLVALGLQPLTDDWDWRQFDAESWGSVSWMHIRDDATAYYGPSNVYFPKGAKYYSIWHQVRDPLKSLTSMAFTEPLTEEINHSEFFHSDLYLQFLKRHIAFANQTQVQDQLIRQNATLARYDVARQPKCSPWTLQLRLCRNPTKLPVNDNPLEQQLLLYRAMEFYLQWHEFIVKLKVPRFHLEDIIEHQNMEVLEQLFASVHHPIQVNHTLAKEYLKATKDQKSTNSRQHRSTVQWQELCRIDAPLTKRFLGLSHKLGYYQDKKSVCV